MKRFIPLLLPVILFMTSCRNHSKPSILNSTNLKSSFIILNGDSTYSLRTPKGAVLKIARNSFDVAANRRVQIEIKEAYTAADILLAGLTTKSDGELLRSGGMIYLNATSDGEDVKIIKPIQVSIPTDRYDNNMQLFKGEIKTDSSINWIDPKPLDTSIITKELLAGKILFNANCSSCHKPAVDFTGPALARCREREPDPEWAYKFTNNTNVMLETDPYARAQIKRYGSKMTQFNLRKEEIKEILDYCDSEMPEQARPTVTNATNQTTNQNNTPSCIDTFYTNLPDTSIGIVATDSALEDSASQIDSLSATDQMKYQFKIFESGWYNIDCFIDVNQGALTKVNLGVNIELPKDMDAIVYLCIPKRRLLTTGDKSTDNSYYFDENDGTIPLILSDEAFIFVMGADEAKKMYYGISKFTVQKNQAIKVAVKESSKESIFNSIKSNKLDDVKIDSDKPETRIVDKKVYPIQGDTTSKKQEMQIMERPCNSDTPRYAFLVGSK